MYTKATKLSNPKTFENLFTNNMLMKVLLDKYYQIYSLKKLFLCYSETSNFLILALKKQILRFNLADSKPKPEELPVQNLENVIAIDFDMKNNCLFYGDLQKDVIVVSIISSD